MSKEMWAQVQDRGRQEDLRVWELGPQANWHDGITLPSALRNGELTFSVVEQTSPPRFSVGLDANEAVVHEMRAAERAARLFPIE